MKDTAQPTRPDPVAFLTGRVSGTPRPAGISLPGEGGKFATDGTVQRWPGNTFVCHVDPASAAHDRLRALQEEVKTSRFARFFTFLPPSSFHMTVFQGISPATTDPALLPRGAAPGASRDAMTAAMLHAVGPVAFAPAQTVRMADLFCCKSLTVTGPSPEGTALLRRMRETLREATGITPPDFDSYVFHITLAYLIEWLTLETAQAVADFSADLTQRHAAGLANIPLGPVEFCTFETMHHFAPLRALV